MDTDLGERIVQLRHEPPSHIVIPAIHLRRREIGELFHRTMGTPAGEEDPTRLAHAARQDLRARFLAADAGITGVNFAVAETGSIVICTNEGNADLGTVLPRTHIACMGAEKLIPNAGRRGGVPAPAGPQRHRPADHRLHHPPHRPRSQPARPRGAPGDRRRRPQQPERRRRAPPLAVLHPLRRLPEHLPGLPPVQRPQLRPDRARARSDRCWGRPWPAQQLARELPFASTLCGSCTNVCPVKIDLHDQLLSWRRRLAEQKIVPWSKRLAMRVGAWVMSPAAAVRAWPGRWVRRLWPLITLRLPGNPLGPWLGTDRARCRPRRAAVPFRAHALEGEAEQRAARPGAAAAHQGGAPRSSRPGPEEKNGPAMDDAASSTASGARRAPPAPGRLPAPATRAPGSASARAGRGGRQLPGPAAASGARQRGHAAGIAAPAAAAWPAPRPRRCWPGSPAGRPRRRRAAQARTAWRTSSSGS